MALAGLTDSTYQTSPENVAENAKESQPTFPSTSRGGYGPLRNEESDCPDGTELQATTDGASLTASMINLTNTIVGAGVLGLPYAYSKAGILLGTFFLLFFGAAAGLGLHLLHVSARKVHPRQGSFYTVAHASIPKFAFLIDVAVAIKCFGVATSYLLVIGDLLPSALSGLACSSSACSWVTERENWIGIFLVFIVPLCYLKTVDSLKFTSALCLVFVIYLTVTVILHEYLPKLDPCDSFPGVKCPGSKTLAQFDLDTLKTISIFIFAYTCHQNIFAISNELQVNTEARVDVVVTWAVSNAAVVYLLVASYGYLALGSLVSSNVLTDYPSSTLVLVAKLAVAWLVAFSYPLQLHPCRRSLLQLIFGNPDVLLPAHKWRWLGSTTAILVASVGLGLVLKDLGLVLAVVGASASTMMCYILPGLVYMQLYPQWHPRRVFACALMIAGLVIMPVCLASIIFF
jgi:amino acid permease